MISPWIRDCNMLQKASSRDNIMAICMIRDAINPSMGIGSYKIEDEQEPVSINTCTTDPSKGKKATKACSVPF